MVSVLHQKYLNCILKQFDRTGDGQISFDEFVNFVTHFPKAWVDADGFLIGRKEMYFIMSGVVDHGKVGKNGVSEDEYLVVIDGDRTDTAYILSRSGDLQSSETGRAEFESIVAELRRRGFQLPTK